MERCSGGGGGYGGNGGSIMGVGGGGGGYGKQAYGRCSGGGYYCPGGGVNNTFGGGGIGIWSNTGVLLSTYGSGGDVNNVSEPGICIISYYI